jgi:hypothetical protein
MLRATDPSGIDILARIERNTCDRLPPAMACATNTNSKGIAVSVSRHLF